MNVHWARKTPDASGDGAPRMGRFDLELLRHGARTVIGRQFVSYPFHMTRPFSLDAALPHLITVYQQSSSGGLYRAEQLQSHLSVRARAAAHVTTQAATIVHDCHGQPAMQSAEVVLEDEAFLALTPDTLVLFPGASYVSDLNVRMGPGSIFFLAEAIAQHDPKIASHPFDTYVSNVMVRDANGKRLLSDCQRITGEALASAASPIGKWSVVSNFMLLGAPSRLPRRAELNEILSSVANAVAGASELPNNAGLGVRCLAQDAVAARQVAEQLFSACVRTALGHQPAPRRK